MAGASAHTLSIPEILTALGTRPGGLTSLEADERLARFGPNAIARIRAEPLLRRFAANFTHLMACLLWVGGLVGFAARMPELGIAIWLVNVINGVFSFWQEFRAGKAVEALRQVLPQQARVLRGGQEGRVPAEQVVPGDVVILSEGDRISADARVIAEAELRVDQSTLTGEAHPARKAADPFPDDSTSQASVPCLVLAGTMVASGTGRAVVFATGMATVFGQIARLTQALPEAPSPLQKEMQHVTRVVSAVAVSVGLSFFALAVIQVGIDLSEGFLFALGMIVAFVPEGLLPTVTLALAMGVQRMARRNALVKKLSAVETLGCTSVICTDKTGTLTQNEMTVRELWLPGRTLDVEGVGYAPVGRICEQGTAVSPGDGDLRLLLGAAALCANARLLAPEPETPRWTVVGDPTEAALLVAARKAGIDLEHLARTAPRVREIPFDSRRKRMTTIHRDPTGPLRACVKGAPREVLELCTRVRRDGGEIPMTAELRLSAAAATDDFARHGLRVLAVAGRLLPEAEAQARDGARFAEEVEQELTLLGLAAMMDPPRPEVSDAVARCRRAGIRVVMITGDYGLTAESVARRIGIVGGGEVRVVAGPELDTLSDDTLDEALGSEVLFARTTPEQKLRVVAALQRLGHVVAVTGDGVNDAPALRQADIGVAMGLSGTDVAKEAADLVLADDNFASIVNAVEEGRAVYANIRKFITYIFTSNTPEAVPFIVYVLTGGKIPLALTVMQILSIDLGTDLVPALALGVEPPEPGLMDRPPRNLAEHAITPGVLVRAYLVLGPIQSAAAMGAFFFAYRASGFHGWWGLPSGGAVYRVATTLALASVVATQIGNLFAQRTERVSLFHIGLFTNRLIWVGIASELAVLAAIVYIPPLQRVFGTAALSWEHWLFLLAWIPCLPLVDELRKALLLRRNRGTRPGGDP
ncbi:MAG: cation-transporting P-type ATPase [Deltaproteobacteria bacterium]|nr:cation-transporting P-type ATPase [Deltaproteobacteria bacterium]